MRLPLQCPPKPWLEEDVLAKGCHLMMQIPLEGYVQAAHTQDIQGPGATSSTR